MFPRVLVASDLGVPEPLATCVGGLHVLGSQEAVLVHCLEMPELGAFQEGLLRLLVPSLDKQVALLKEAGMESRYEVLLGLPQVEINDYAERKDCSLIVVSTRVHSLAAEVILGGVASAVIHSARKPVLVLRLADRPSGREAACETWPCAPLRRVLFPTDFSDNAEHAFGYVERLVEAGAREVTLLHVQDRTKLGKYLEDRLEEFNVTDRGRLERLKSQLLKKGATDVRIELPYGFPTSEILARTRPADASLVVMGSQGRGFVSEIFLGSVSHNVARRAPIPVLLIPAIR
jgi:nucleotide-binding universal stress UspA family protein